MARVVVAPKPGVNDPEGDAILRGLASLGYDAVENVRSGRYFELTVAAADAEDAVGIAHRACEQLLANPVIESYSVTRAELEPVAAAAEEGG